MLRRPTHRTTCGEWMGEVTGFLPRNGLLSQTALEDVVSPNRGRRSYPGCPLGRRRSVAASVARDDHAGDCGA